eukprot:CAMPEP_0197635916 /NCGR_PEP_ID=MMETSP1338-20131121/11593_1 /TAXON_ID=43686 ORGANISM="Pelagodinium beii, Strain RCC1491" /NCGR_SAMPLE_ID=MMETSP1338 /ASSEMBLY_ACC=CAM_ASM_000754 /LENGTH=198 /DNA_ID=CAMNT_0043208057 /DNA_START=38 /DNA_END=634 /DNA_ORIENTATION=-
MIHPGSLEDSKSFFHRYDCQREAQELLKEVRTSASPRAPTTQTLKARNLEGGLTDSLGSNRHTAVVDEPWGRFSNEAKMRLTIGDVTPRKLPADQAEAVSTAAQTPRSRGPAAKAAADLKFRHLKMMAQAQDAPDFRRKNIFRTEQLRDQSRWPDETLWAGHSPEFLRERFDRLGTLTNERGDGRTLLHERGDKFYLN